MSGCSDNAAVQKNCYSTCVRRLIKFGKSLVDVDRSCALKIDLTWFDRLANVRNMTVVRKYFKDNHKSIGHLWIVVFVHILAKISGLLQPIAVYGETFVWRQRVCALKDHLVVSEAPCIWRWTWIEALLRKRAHVRELVCGCRADCMATFTRHWRKCKHISASHISVYVTVMPTLLYNWWSNGLNGHFSLAMSLVSLF